MGNDEPKRERLPDSRSYDADEPELAESEPIMRDPIGWLLKLRGGVAMSWARVKELQAAVQNVVTERDANVLSARADTLHGLRRIIGVPEGEAVAVHAKAMSDLLVDVPGAGLVNKTRSLVEAMDLQIKTTDDYRRERDDAVRAYAVQANAADDLRAERDDYARRLVASGITENDLREQVDTVASRCEQLADRIAELESERHDAMRSENENLRAQVAKLAEQIENVNRERDGLSARNEELLARIEATEAEAYRMLVRMVEP